MEAARDLLLEAGPQAVTLKAVAARIGRTHANLLHHFGSAAELQSALAEDISSQVTAQIADAVERAAAAARRHARDRRRHVRRVRPAPAAGRMPWHAGWTDPRAATGFRDALTPDAKSPWLAIRSATPGRR